MTNKIDLLIFSKNRAPQLDLLIRSILKNAPDEFNIKVLYDWENTDSDYASGYNKILYDSDYSNQLNEDNFYFEGVEFCPFKETLLNIMEACEGELFSMMTDDCIFFRPSPLDDLKKALKYYPEQIGVANLRVGLDTSIDCYFNGKPLPPLNYSELGPNAFFWNHMHYPANSAYQYVNTLDGGIWRHADILDLIKNTEFKNPNELESGLSNKTHWLKPLCVAGNKQSIVAAPVNSVSKWNRAGDVHSYSTEFLNEKFLNGERINLDAAIFFCENNCVATHCEIPYQFCERSE